jgi:hypothetical protein
VVPGLDRRTYGGAPPTDRRSAACTEPVRRSPWRACDREDSNGLGARRMGKSEPRPAGGLGRHAARMPRPAGAGAGRAARVRVRRRDAVAFGPKHFADPWFEIYKLQNFV